MRAGPALSCVPTKVRLVLMELGTPLQSGPNERESSTLEAERTPVPSPGLTMDTRDEGESPDGTRTYRVVVSGEIDIATAPLLAGAFDEVIAAGGRLVILDARDIHFLDSSGISVLISAGSELESHGGRLCIDGMSGAVERVLEITGLLERYRAGSA